MFWPVPSESKSSISQNAEKNYGKLQCAASLLSSPQKSPTRLPILLGVARILWLSEVSLRHLPRSRRGRAFPAERLRPTLASRA